jgi:hypothetical protein
MPPPTPADARWAGLGAVARERRVASPVPPGLVPRLLCGQGDQPTCRPLPTIHVHNGLIFRTQVAKVYVINADFSVKLPLSVARFESAVSLLVLASGMGWPSTGAGSIGSHSEPGRGLGTRSLPHTAAFVSTPQTTGNFQTSCNNTRKTDCLYNSALAGAEVSAYAITCAQTLHSKRWFPEAGNKHGSPTA